MRRTTTTKLVCCALLLSGCATPLQEPPPQDEVLEGALPETTEIRAEWAAPADDDGGVDDGWLATFGDPQLEAPQFESGKAQTVAVGSQIAEFAADVPDEMRPHIANCFLLAQLAALDGEKRRDIVEYVGHRRQRGAGGDHRVADTCHGAACAPC